MTALRDWNATVRIAEPATAPAAGDPIDGTTLRVGAERQRLALALHDEVAPLLFAMASRAGRALEENAHEPDAQRLLATLRTLSAELRATQEQLRGVIRDCGPEGPDEAVPAATQRDLDAFT